MKLIDICIDVVLPLKIIFFFIIILFFLLLLFFVFRGGGGCKILYALTSNVFTLTEQRYIYPYCLSRFLFELLFLDVYICINKQESPNSSSFDFRVAFIFTLLFLRHARN